MADCKKQIIWNKITNLVDSCEVRQFSKYTNLKYLQKKALIEIKQ